MDDPIVLDYHNSLVRRSDKAILSSNSWINDTLIEFWLEYLANEVFAQYSSELVCFSPSLSQIIKLTECIDTIRSMVSSLDVATKSLWIVPVNDSTDMDQEGGNHWSLLVFLPQEYTFEYYDSLPNSCNITHAHNIATKLRQLLSNHPKHESEFKFLYPGCDLQNDSFNCGVHLLCNAEAACIKHLLHDPRSVREIATKQKLQTYRTHISQVIDQLSNSCN